MTLTTRKITIYAIDVISYEFPHLEIEVHCGKGTYIRSLARDLGEKLGCGAYIEKLRRARVGPFKVENALALDAAAAQLIVCCPWPMPWLSCQGSLSMPTRLTIFFKANRWFPTAHYRLTKLGISALVQPLTGTAGWWLL